MTFNTLTVNTLTVNTLTANVFTLKFNDNNNKAHKLLIKELLIRTDVFLLLRCKIHLTRL